MKNIDSNFILICSAIFLGRVEKWTPHCQYTFCTSIFHLFQLLEILNKIKNIDSMNNKTNSDVVKHRITRRSEKKKKEEEDLTKTMKIRKVTRTRFEEKNMRSLEEMRLRSEDIGLGSILMMMTMVVLPRWRCSMMR